MKYRVTIDTAKCVLTPGYWPWVPHFGNDNSGVVVTAPDPANARNEAAELTGVSQHMLIATPLGSPELEVIGLRQIIRDVTRHLAAIATSKLRP